MIMEDTDTTDNGSALEKKASIRFEDDFDYKPLKKGAGASLEDKLFGLLRGKKKIKTLVKPQEKSKPKMAVQAEAVPDSFFEEGEVKLPLITANPITGHDLVARTPRIPKLTSKFAIKPLSTLAVNAVIKGMALAVFAAGGFLIYAELPTHPELVIGIVMVSVAGNVVVSR
jgi:hypothetical protein